jgi:DTW domain-containing protein YfiP
MYAKLPAVHGVPKLALPEKAARVLRLRESKFEAGRSTLEAIAEAIGLLEGEAVAAPLHALHAAYVERVFRARGVWEHKRGIEAV